MCGARIELCREDGSLLRPIMLDECKGGPHEFRGVYRGGLLRTLGSGVPAERIHYNCAVESLRQDDDGVSHTNLPCHARANRQTGWHCHCSATEQCCIPSTACW